MQLNFQRQGSRVIMKVIRRVIVQTEISMVCRAVLKFLQLLYPSSSIVIFADTSVILISIVSNSYYGMPRGQIHINLPPEHPIMSFGTIEIKMAAVSANRSIGVDNQRKLFDFSSFLACFLRFSVECRPITSAANN